jgi:hypothetical protein
MVCSRSRWQHHGRDGQQPRHRPSLRGHEPYAYLKDVLQRLPTQPASALAELLLYRWKPST